MVLRALDTDHAPSETRNRLVPEDKSIIEEEWRFKNRKRFNPRSSLMKPNVC